MIHEFTPYRVFQVYRQYVAHYNNRNYTFGEGLNNIKPEHYEADRHSGTYVRMYKYFRDEADMNDHLCVFFYHMNPSYPHMFFEQERYATQLKNRRKKILMAPAYHVPREVDSVLEKTTRGANTLMYWLNAVYSNTLSPEGLIYLDRVLGLIPSLVVEKNNPIQKHFVTSLTKYSTFIEPPNQADSAKIREVFFRSFQSIQP